MNAIPWRCLAREKASKAFAPRSLIRAAPNVPQEGTARLNHSRTSHSSERDERRAPNW